MLTIDQFLEREAACRLVKPGLFRLASPDPPASREQIESVERIIRCQLPPAYRNFLMVRGGGDYPGFDVFSANPGSDLYLPTRIAELGKLVGPDLLPIHDDRAGGLYVLKVIEGSAGDALYYWDWETRELSNVKYDSLLDAIVDLVFS